MEKDQIFMFILPNRIKGDWSWCSTFFQSFCFCVVINKVKVKYFVSSCLALLQMKPVGSQERDKKKISDVCPLTNKNGWQAS